MQNDKLSPKNTRTFNLKSIYTFSVISFLSGAIITALTILLIMPGMMIITKQSRLDFDGTVSAIEKAIPENGWASPGTMNMNEALVKHGVEFSPRVSLIKLCNAEYAKSVLDSDRYISCMMPCTIAVWEDDDGKIFISKMNMELMAKIFGGNIKKVMGGSVVGDEKAILEGILR